MDRDRQTAFTLIELLVVLAIILLLASVLMGALGMARERSRRVVCQANIRQFILALHSYGRDHRESLPSGQSEKGDDEHTPVITPKTRDEVLHYAESRRIYTCPSLREPFTNPDGWYYDGYGYVIGYNYLGGHDGTPWPMIGLANNHWISPCEITDYSWRPLVTDLNAWSAAEEKTFAPHGQRGAILEAKDSGNPSAGGIPSQRIGAAGGNVGLLDASVAWKHIENMSVYRGSRMYDEDGCFTAW